LDAVELCHADRLAGRAEEHERLSNPESAMLLVPA
jgi:hypothetical protein